MVPHFACSRCKFRSRDTSPARAVVEDTSITKTSKELDSHQKVIASNGAGAETCEVCKQSLEMEVFEAFDEAVALDKPYEAQRLAKRAEELAESSVETQEAYNRRKKAIHRVLREARELENLLAEIDSLEGWTKSLEKDGVAVFFKKEEGSPFLVTKSSKTFSAVPGKPATYTFLALVSLFAEVDLMPNYFPRGLMKSNEVLKAETKFSRFTRIRIQPPLFLPISKREVIIEGKGYDITQERSAICIGVRTLPKDFTQDGFTVPDLTPGYTRFDIRAAYYIQILEDGSCYFANIQFIDLKLSFVPPAVLNLVSKGAVPLEFVSNLTKAFDQFEGSQWQNRILEQPEIYEDIRERLEVYLASVRSKHGSCLTSYNDSSESVHIEDNAQDTEDIYGKNPFKLQSAENVHTHNLSENRPHFKVRSSLTQNHKSPSVAWNQEKIEEDENQDLFMNQNDEGEESDEANNTMKRRIRRGLRDTIQSALEYVWTKEDAYAYADNATSWIEPHDETSQRRSLLHRLSRRISQRHSTNSSPGRRTSNPELSPTTSKRSDFRPEN